MRRNVRSPETAYPDIKRADGKKRIAIIDDDPDILELLTDFFTEAGFDVRASTDGEDIFDIINADRPDIILMDFVISGMDGSVVCKWLKSQEASRNIPIIMISAHPEAEDTAKDSGADGVIAKPFDVEQVRKTVDRYLRQPPASP